MSIFQSVGQKLSDAARSAAKASSDFIEVSKLQMAIRTEEEKMKELMLEIGSYIYESYKDGKPLEDVLSVKCDEISASEKEISQLKVQALEVRNLVECPDCKAEVENTFIYCPKCGTRL